MPIEPSFKDLMSAWLRAMQIEPPKEAPHDVYTLDFEGGITIHFCALLPGWLDVFAEAGALPSRQAADVLMRLLALNRVGMHALLSVGVDDYSGRVFVCARYPFTQLGQDALGSLAQRMQERVREVRQCLAGQGGVRPSHGSRPAVLQRALRTVPPTA